MPILFLAPILPALWLAWKAFRLPLPLPLRLLLMALSIVVSQLYNIQHRLFGSLAGPDVPALALELQIWAFVTMVLLFFLVVFRDLAGLVLRLVRALSGKKTPGSKAARAAADPSLSSAGTAARVPAASAGPHPSPKRGTDAFTRRSFLTGSAMLGASALVSGFGVRNAIATPVINAWEFFLPDLPEGLEGFRLVYMADLHLGPLSRSKNLAALVSNINDLHPDMICLGGDLADGFPDWRCADATPRGSLAGLLGQLHSRYGTYACTGNHEYYSSYTSWMRLWQEQNIHFLHNASVAIPHRDAQLLVAGLNDPVSGTRHASLTPFAQAEQQAGLAPGADQPERVFRLLLDHRPSAVHANAALGAQLQLSGHTHGGQCPGLSRAIAKANQGFVRGWYDVDGMPLYVTCGAALWPGFAVRINVPAEAACITLHQGARRQTRVRI